MAKYQIEYNLGGSSKSYKYFEANSDLKTVATKKANEVLRIEFTTARIGSFQPLQPPRTLMVREYDTVSKKPVKGGNRLKLKLKSETMKAGGVKVKNSWYEPVE
jgi:hypothetical protein